MTLKTTFPYQPILLIIAAAACFAGVLQHEFVNLDDNVLIYQNPLIRNTYWNNLSEVFKAQFGTFDYKPIVYLSWIVEYKLFGLDPAVYHFNNLLLHILNSLLVFGLIRKIIQKLDYKEHANQVALFAALIWSLHPLRVESFAWAAEREDVLSGFFYFLGIHAWLKFSEQRRFVWLLAFGVSFVLAYLSKATAITLPVVALLSDYLCGGLSAKFDYKKLKWVLPIGLGVVLALLGLNTAGLSSWVVGDETAMHPENIANLPLFVQMLLLLSYRFVFYLGHFLAPIGLSVVYSRQVLVQQMGSMIYLMPIITAALLWLYWRYAFRDKFVFWAGAVFIVAMAPAWIIPSYGTNFVTDRYTYLGSIGLSALLPYLLLVQWPKIASVAQYILIGIVAIFALLAYNRLSVWQNSYTLFNDALTKYPKLPLALNNRGLYYLDNNNLDSAFLDFNEAVKLNPSFTTALYNRGKMLFDQKRFDEALKDFNQVLAVDSSYQLGYISRATVYAATGNDSLAFIDYNRAIAMDRYSPDAYKNMGKLYVRRNDYKNAIDSYTKYLNFSPNDPEVLYLRGMVYEMNDQMKESLSDLNKAININPNNGYYYSARSKTHYIMGNIQPAWNDAKTANAKGVPVRQEYLQILLSEGAKGN